MNSGDEIKNVPIIALRKSTIAILSAGLNQHKIIPSDEGLPRDWRGLAHLFRLNGVETARISGSRDPVAELIKSHGAKINIDKLKSFLALIDRFDVLDDSELLVEEDVKLFIERAVSPYEISTQLTSHVSSDSMILTVDDAVRLGQGLDPQVYDAYLLFAEEDISFASEIVDTLEQQYQMKLCIRDRDLVGGIPFEHDAIMKLIAERCTRLLVVVSPSFLQSSANKFFVTFAQALGIDQRQRKVIPILYQRCQLPPELSYYFLLDYNRAGVLWNFWSKLRDSIKATDSMSTSLQSASPWMSKTVFTEEMKRPLPAVTAPIDKETAFESTAKEEKLEESKKSSKKPIAQSLTSLFSRKEKDVILNNTDKPQKKKWFGKKKVSPLLS